MKPNTAVKRACEIVGSQAELARILGVHSTLPHQWIIGHRPIPSERCSEVEQATGGKVTCEQLRPDLKPHWSYLRGTGSKAKAA